MLFNKVLRDPPKKCRKTSQLTNYVKVANYADIRLNLEFEKNAFAFSKKLETLRVNAVLAFVGLPKELASGTYCRIKRNRIILVEACHPHCF